MAFFGCNHHDSAYRAGNTPFHRDNNTPHKSTVWGTCNHCHHEGWAERTDYSDGTTYYTCKHHGCRDNFSEHPPGFGNGLRRKQADRPTEGWNDAVTGDDWGANHINGRDPLKGRKLNRTARAYCKKCRGHVTANVEEDIESGHIAAHCSQCGNKIGPRDMQPGDAP